MTNYLMYNIQLLAYSAGYSVRGMLNELGMNRNLLLFNPDVFADRYQDRIEQFLRRQNKDWLMDLFEKSKLSIMDKVDGCVFSDHYTPDAFRRNINAIGYFLSVPWCELASDLGCSNWRMQCIRDDPYSYDESEWVKIYDIFMYKYAKSEKNREFLLNAAQYRILNQIPHHAFNRPRNNYIPYNGTQDEN